MKAIGFRDVGQENVLTLMEIPVPKIDENEVLVRIKAIGVGKHDRWFIPKNAIFPYAIGIEGAGVIQEIGDAVTAHQPGARVMFTSAMQPKGGTWAEFAAVSEQALIPIPDGLSFVDAAALPVAGGTALEGVRALNLKSGETVFIAGASGAIGTLAIQLATARGSRVAVSASSKNHAYMLDLGAEKAFDYRDSDWPIQVKTWQAEGVDAALAIQRGTGITSLRVVKTGGRVVTISGDQFSSERNIRVEQIAHHPDTQIELAKLAIDAASGRIRIVVEQTYPLEEAHIALEKTETGHARGKTILTI